MGEFMSSNDITRKTGMSASNQTFSVKFGNKSGGGGTSDYEQLDNLPKIEGVTLIGDKSASDLGLATPSDIPDVSDFVTETDMQTALADKADRTDIPTVPTNVSAFNNDSGYQTAGEVRTAILDEVPTKLSDLDDDMMHRTVTDTEKSNWNGKSNFSGDYNDLTNKPTIPTVPTNVSAFNNDAGYQTSSDVATAISGKADASDVYTKAEVDTALGAKANSADVYTKTQIDTMLIMDVTNTIFGGE